MSANCDEMAERAADALHKGQLDDARLLLDDILAEDPSHADGLQLMGVFHQKKGDLGTAKKYFEHAIEIAPDGWPARVNLAGLSLRMGDLTSALHHAREASVRAPDVPAVWRHLADAAERSAEFEQGSIALERLSALGQADARTELRGALHGILGKRFSAAASALERARNKGASDAQLRLVEAELAVAQGNWGELKNIAAIWRSEAPGDRKAIRQAARAELELGNLNEAADLFRPLIEGTTEVSAEDALVYGRICLNAQRIEEAENYLNRAAAVLPKHADALTSLARLKTFMGDFVEAQRLCERAIEAEPENARPYLQLTTVLRGRISETYREAMSSLKRQGLADPALQAGLAFSLGDIAFRNKQAERALKLYQEGNSLRKSQGESRRFLYDPTLMESDVTLLREMSLPLKAHSHDAEMGMACQPIFITGMPRSGTTLIERIIGAHPDVTPMGERMAGPTLLEAFLMRARKEGAAGAVQWAIDERDALRREYMASTERIDTTYFTDKMPGNALAMPLLSMLFPGAKFLLTIRRPFDVAVSIFRHQFPFAYSWAHRFEDIGHYFPTYMAAAADFVRERPICADVVGYDDLVADPDSEIPDLIAKAGLEWDDACANPATEGRSIATFSSVQARGEISEKSSDGGYLFRALMEEEADHLDKTVLTAIGR